MLSCDAIWDLLSAYIDDEVTPEEATLVQQHVAECPDCARDLLFMRRTAADLAHTPEVAPPPGLQQAILAATVYRPTWRQRLQTALRSGFSSPARVRAFGLAGAAAAFFGLMLMQFQRPSPSMRVSPHSTAAPPQIARLIEPPAIVTHTEGKGQPGHNPRAGSPATPRSPAPGHVIPMGGLRPVDYDKATPVNPAPRAGTPKRGTPRPVAPPRSNNRAGEREVARLRPDTVAPPAVEPKTPETAPEEKKTPDRTMVAEITPKPSESKSGGAPSVPAASESVRIKLASVERSMGAGPVASLADLRRALRRDNEAVLTNSALYNLNDRREMTLAVLKTRF